MSRLTAYAIIFWACLFNVALSAQHKPLNTKPQMDAEYPGGLEALYQYITSNMIYPDDARMLGIEGKLLIRFVVNSSGVIDPLSVAAIVSLFPTCDEEAKRVLKLNTTQWNPASINNVPVDQEFVLPITFVFTDSAQQTNFFASKTVRGVVKEKPSRASKREWSVYADNRMQLVRTTVAPMDTVEVIGWAPWLYIINKGNVYGHLSWLALEETEDIKSIKKEIAENSPELEKILLRADSANQSVTNLDKTLLNKKPVDDLTSKTAFLKVSAAKSIIYVGECTNIDLAFFVGYNNQLKLQFYDLGYQLQGIINKGLSIKDCWSSSSIIENIEGNPISIGSDMYTNYTIYQAAYCPMKTGQIVFNPVKLNFLKRANSDGEADLVSFTSKPTSITVKPLPQSANPTRTDHFTLVGDFSVADKIRGDHLITKKRYVYSITIKGQGLTYPIEPPNLTLTDVFTSLLDFNHSDTIINNQYYSSRTFNYHVIFNRSGAHDFSKAFSWNAFDHLSNKMITLRSTTKVEVKEAPAEWKDEPVTTDFFYRSNIIALDASKSMMVEDYSPNRLAFAKNSIEKFLSARTNCDVGLLVFGADAKQYNLQSGSTCYAKYLLQAINFNMVERGTAIGNAIWLSVQSVRPHAGSKKLVIIGDGDNTAGVLPVASAIEIAKRNGLKIYTIGIGTKGPAAFGKDNFGRPNWVDNTFSDEDLKRIANLTGGKYYWAKDADDIATFLEEIFD